MWIEYEDGIYNTDNWKTVECRQIVSTESTFAALFGSSLPEGTWVVIVNGEDIMYQTTSEDFARQFYTKIKSALGVGRMRLNDPS